MAHRITLPLPLPLPLRPRPPASSSPDTYFPRGQPPFSNNNKSNNNNNNNTQSTTPNSYNRSRAFSISRPHSPSHGFKPFGGGGASDFENDKENMRLRGSTDLSPIGSEDEDEDEEAESFERQANPRTWGNVEQSPFLHHGAMLPMGRREAPRPRWRKDVGPTARYNGGNEVPEDTTSMLYAPTTPPPSRMLAPDCDQFLKMMDEKLQLEPHKAVQGAATAAAAAAAADHNIPHVRSASSSYPSQGNASTRVQSPDSILRANRLSLTDLSRFSRANDRLSNLRSSSSLSELHDRSTRENQEVLQESSSAIAQWQKELRPRPSSYLQYELSESAEVLPSDSLSQQMPSSSRASPSRAVDSPGLTWQGLHAIRAQYDGVHEANLPSPTPELNSPPSYAPPSYTQHLPGKQSKRKASYFSLRSLSNISLGKRPRLGLRKWANNVYQQGSNRLRLARQKFREQAELDRKMFEAWRIQRRDRQQPRRSHRKEASPPRPRPRYGGGFPERRTDDWWKEGVSRFEAPKWMFRGANGNGVSQNQ
ncbi:hypothetical protein PT974_00674 [Cladobotryum mycophilum]|uniref:Uncharacterized protein n=1 Tax=Cladobotryum mycophilum TaxID=491253 RepID=A0ABR0T254_9HYPO